MDDEPLIVKGLTNIIKQGCGFVGEIGTAMDGLEALEQMDALQPDLVITDIYMPEMNGFELIESILNKGTCKRFVILTGYDDFELARKAIRLQTIDYLLKPVNKTELMTILEKVFRDIHEEKLRQRNRELSKIREMILYNVPLEEVALQGFAADEWFPHPYFFMLVLQFKDVADPDVCLGAVHETLPDNGIRYEFVSAYKNQFILLCNMASGLQEQELAALGRILSEQSQEGGRFDIGMVQAESCFPHLYPLYAQAERSLFYSMHAPSGAPGRLPGDRLQFDAAGLHHVMDALTGASGSADFTDPADSGGLLQAYTGKLASDAKDDAGLLGSIYAVLASEMSVYMQNHGIAMESVLPARTAPTAATMNAWQFESRVSALFDAAVQALRQANAKSKYSESIEKILDYIAGHYKSDMSLESIADLVYLHPTYVSILFKKETGVSFIRYLHTYRTNKAKEIMIRDKDIAVSKVAGMVGYENPGHFFKIFKKLTGVTPGQFRDSP